MHPISIDTDGVCRTLLSPDCVQHTIMVTLQGNVFTSAVKRSIGPRRNYHEGRAAFTHFANQTARPL